MSEERDFKDLVKEKIALLRRVHHESATQTLTSLDENAKLPFEELCAGLSFDYKPASGDPEIEKNAYQAFYNFLNGSATLEQSKQAFSVLKTRDRENMSLDTGSKVFLFVSGITVILLAGAGILAALFALWIPAITVIIVAIIFAVPGAYIFKALQSEFDHAVSSERHLIGSFEKFLNDFTNNHQALLLNVNSKSGNFEQKPQQIETLKEEIKKNESPQTEQIEKNALPAPSDSATPDTGKKSESPQRPLFHLYTPVLDDNKEVLFQGRDIARFATIKECFDFLKQRGHNLENANLIATTNTLHLKDVKSEENFDIVYQPRTYDAQGEVLQFEPNVSCYWITETFSLKPSLSFEAFSEAHKVWVKEAGCSAEQDRKAETNFREGQLVDENPEKLSAHVGSSSNTSASFNQVVSQPSPSKKEKDTLAYIKPQVEQAVRNYPGTGFLEIPIFTFNEKSLISQILPLCSQPKLHAQIKTFLEDEYKKRIVPIGELIDQIIPRPYDVFASSRYENKQITLGDESIAQKFVRGYPLPQNSEVALISDALKNHRLGDLYISVFSDSELSLIEFLKKLGNKKAASVITQTIKSACQEMRSTIQAVMPSIQQLRATSNGKLIIPEDNVAEFKRLYEDRLSKDNIDSKDYHLPQSPST